MNVTRGALVSFVASAVWLASHAVIAQELGEVTVEMAADAEAAADEEAAEKIAIAEQEAFQMLQLQADPKFARVQAHLRVDAALMRRVCELSDDQEAELSKLDDEWLKQVMKVKAQGQANPGLIAAFFGARPQNQGNNVDHAAANKKVHDSLKSILDEQQQAVFVAEVKKRDQFRAEATTAALVEALHERLDLTEEQCEQIEKRIVHWVGAQDLVVKHFFSGNNYYPNIPVHMLDALTKEQKTLYNSLQKHLFTLDNFHDGNDPILVEK